MDEAIVDYLHAHPDHIYEQAVAAIGTHLRGYGVSLDEYLRFHSPIRALADKVTVRKGHNFDAAIAIALAAAKRFGQDHPAWAEAVAMWESGDG